MATIVSDLNPETLEDFRSQLGGHIFLPGQPEYDLSRTLWNGMIDQQPAIIVQPTGVSDVKHAIAFAREHELELSIKDGGHNVAGYALTNGGMTLDLELMRGVWVDPQRRMARVGGGARWSDLDRETSVFGLATTGGVISTTGVTGLTLGGGVGWLVGKHGLASDNLLSVELVTANGEVITASPESHPDLFWALRGGGGNFGVVTSMEFQLHPQGMVFAGMVAHPPDRAREVLEFYRELSATAPDELVVYCGLMAEPEEGQRVAAIAFCWSGDPADGEKALQPLLEFGPPVMTMVDTMPYAILNGANDILFPHGRNYYWKGAMMRELDDRVLDIIAERAANPPLPWLNVTIECYSGAMNRREPTATAFPHRDAHYQVVIIGAWDDPEQEEVGVKWAREIHAEIEPYAKQGAFLNFVAVDGNNRQERVKAGYGHNWDRLVEVKRHYDPDNVFHRNNNVTP